jgi:hypothetical protein
MQTPTRRGLDVWHGIHPKQEGRMTEKNTPGIFRALGHLIPGYTGYVRREARRDTDKILRDTIARRLDETKASIDDMIRDRTAGGNLDGLSNLSRLKTHLATTADMIRYASHGASGLFDLVQVKEADLDKLHQFDLSVAQDADKIADKVQSLPKAEDADAESAGLIKELDQLQEKMRARERIIQEVR